MTLEIFIPEISNNPKNSKDAIITALTTEWPLTIKKIYNKLKKQFGYSSTYQSVYKSVQELKEKEIIRENKEGFEINIEWIKKLQSFTDIVETNYYAKSRMTNISGFKDAQKNDNILILNFDTIFDAEKYLYYFIKTEMLKTKNDSLCFQTSNEWKPIFYLRAEYNYYKKLSQNGHKCYFLCAGKSYLEELSRTFYKKIGVKVKTTENKNPQDIIIFGDYYIQIFIPEELRSKMKSYLEKKDIIQLLEKVLEEKTASSIKVLINKDLALAKELKKQFINKFK